MAWVYWLTRPVRNINIEKGTGQSGHARHEDCECPDSWVSPSLSPFLTRCPPPAVSSVRPQCSEEETCHRFKSNNTTRYREIQCKRILLYLLPEHLNTVYIPGNQNKEPHFRICGNLNPFADRSRINISIVYSLSLIFFSKLNIQSQWEFPAKTVGTPDLPGPDFWLWIHRWIDNID